MIEMFLITEFQGHDPEMVMDSLNTQSGCLFGNCGVNTLEFNWVHHDAVLRAVSEEFPGVVFQLQREMHGGEVETMWNKRYINGLCQVQKYQIVAQDWSAFN